MRAISIDVGGTTLKVGVCSADGVLTHKRQAPTAGGVDALVAQVAQQAHALRTELADEGDVSDLVEPVGVVVPGIVDARNGLAVHSVNLGWRDIPMRDLMATALGSPVAFGHDVSSGALAETRWGAGAGPGETADTLFVAIGTGLSASLILNGTAFTGAGYVGELGHILVDDPADGSRTVLEQIASASAIARRFAALRPGFDVARGSFGVLEEVDSGDPHARAVVDQAVTVLAEALAGAICLTGPMRIIIGGGLSNAGEAFLDPLRTALAQNLVVTPVPPIEAAQLGSWSQCMGAGAMALDLAHDLAAGVLT